MPGVRELLKLLVYEALSYYMYAALSFWSMPGVRELCWRNDRRGRMDSFQQVPSLALHTL